MSQRPSRVRRCRTACFALALLVSACASTLPTDRPPTEVALAPRAEGRLAAVEQRVAALHGAEASGFRLLERNADGLIWRVALIDSAQHAIDLQY
jgi:hypothetical protein